MNRPEVYLFFYLDENGSIKPLKDKDGQHKRMPYGLPVEDHNRRYHSILNAHPDLIIIEIQAWLKHSPTAEVS